MERIVLAYSGGLDASVAIRWLAETHQAEIVTLTLDIGQRKVLEEVQERALATGASRAHVLDVREEFVREYVLPALKADALYEDRYPMATALGQALIAKKLVEVARLERADAIAHGCRGNGHDRMRLDVAVRALDPHIAVMAPAREWGMTQRQEIEYARARGIAVVATTEGAYRVNSNLWGRSIACDVLDEAWTGSLEEIYTLTKSPSDCPDESAAVEITFERGEPTAINGVAMPLVDLIASLGTIAGAHGVGRLGRIEKQEGGVTSREVYEAPAAVVLHAAHNALQRSVTTKDVDRSSHEVSVQYAELVHSGLWFTPLREALDAHVDRVQERVAGDIRLQLFRGDYRVVTGHQPLATSHQRPAPKVFA